MGLFSYMSTEEGKGEEVNVSKVTVHSLLFFIIMSVVLNSYTTVPAGHVKVQTLFGKVVHGEFTEGFHVVNPLADFSVYDGRKQTYHINGIMVPSQDKLKTAMDVSIIYSLTTSQASDMKQEIGSLEDFEDKFLLPKARSLIREVGKGVKDSQSFFLDHIQQEIQTKTTERLAIFMEERGVVVHNVLFRDVTLPNVVANAIIQTKKRQEEVNQEKAKLDIAEQQAQQQVIQAKAKELAALAEANAKRTRADAEAYEIEAVATATAKGNLLINKTLTKDLIEASRIEKWNGAYPSTMLGGSSGVLLNIPVK